MNVVCSCFVGVSFFLLPTVAFADLPLTVEDLITDKGRIKLDISVYYANQDFQGVATGEPVMVQTGPTSFVALPSEIGEVQGNADAVVGTLGLRYGLSTKAELYSRASWFYSSARSRVFEEILSESERDFLDAWVGLNYEIKEDGDTLALLGFSEVALREKHSKSSSSFKSYLVGLTTYKAIDPVVFSLTTAYRLNQSRKDGDAKYKPGNMLLFNPSIGFAVNDRVTLTTGFQWTNRQPDTFDGKTEDFRRTGTNLLMGVVYGISKKSIANFIFSTNVSGRNGAGLRLNWLNTF